MAFDVVARWLCQNKSTQESIYRRLCTPIKQKLSWTRRNRRFLHLANPLGARPIWLPVCLPFVSFGKDWNVRKRPQPRIVDAKIARREIDTQRQEALSFGGLSLKLASWATSLARARQFADGAHKALCLLILPLLTGTFRRRF